MKKVLFTGAKQGKPGKFELADGGTIFLDEVSEIPSEYSGKLLTVIQDRVVERIGGVTPRSIDIRIIAASIRTYCRTRENLSRGSLLQTECSSCLSACIA